MRFLHIISIFRTRILTVFSRVFPRGIHWCRSMGKRSKNGQKDGPVPFSIHPGMDRTGRRLRCLRVNTEDRKAHINSGVVHYITLEGAISICIFAGMPSIKTIIKKHVTEAMVWKIFSMFIRLRDADDNGVAICFTCGRHKLWTQGDCGHGIPRQHKATKFNETNNHFQCKQCNGFEGGMREVYAKNVDARYGPGTWAKLLVASRATCKRNSHDFQIMYSYYVERVAELKKQKHL